MWNCKFKEMIKNRHIYLLQWLLCSILTVLCSACSSGDAGEGTGITHKQAKLAIYVYAPEQAAAKRNGAPHRANEGEVDAIIGEGTIDSLQIWIYESATGNYVGYFGTKDVTALNEGQGSTYQIPVSDDFARNKPDVNVYVMANVTYTNCGVGTLDKNTNRTDLLNGAKIANGHFGLEQNVRAVPAGGLPFAGRLTAQPVVGDAPTLRIGTLSAVSTVQLTRAVSKLRFVFAKTTGQPTVNITSIKINADMIPYEEYLFQTPASMTYNAEAVELLLDDKGDIADITDIAETADPTQYLYLGQEAQAYEDLINAAANKQPNPEVTVNGPVYLRESDKQLAGTITYKIGDAEPKTVDFAMQQAGDFKRNHTWIVYAYYAGAGKLQVQSLYVKEWSTKELNHQVYNW
jgi:hypothetical protein